MCTVVGRQIDVYGGGQADVCNGLRWCVPVCVGCLVCMPCTSAMPCTADSSPVLLILLGAHGHVLLCRRHCKHGGHPPAMPDCPALHLLTLWRHPLACPTDVGGHPSHLRV